MIGIAGYIIIERYSLLDAFYMTIITLATVGFTEVQPLHAEGKLFTSFLVIIGFGIVAFAATSLTEIILEGKVFRKRRLEKKVDAMKNHIIVCGYGRIGQRVAQRLSEQQVPFVVIEKDEEIISTLSEKGLMYIEGNAIEDEVLMRANPTHARSLVAVLNSDADNVYVVLTARSINPSLHIVARASDAASHAKLLRAGANKVISPYYIGGSYLANAVLRPNVVDFMEVVSETHSDRERDLEIEEILVTSESPFVGKTLRDLPIRSEMNIIVLAIKVSDGSMHYNPSPDRVISAGDMLICIGFIDKLDVLTKLIQS